MRKRIEHSVPFIAYFTTCAVAAGFHYAVAPLVVRGSRFINGSPFTPSGLAFAMPIGVILYALPPAILILLALSYKFPHLRSAEFMAGLGCGLALLLLAYACALSYPLVERSLLNR